MREKWTPHIIAVNALVVFIVLGLACASAPEGTVAQEVRQDNNEKDFEFDWDGYGKGNIVITKYIGSKKEVHIPASIQNNPVTSIGRGYGRTYQPFKDCKSITSVTIPDSVTIIGDRAFEGCTSLTSINIPDSVTSIDFYAFHETAWLNNQPEGVVYIDKWAYTYKGTMPANTKITLLDGTKGIAGGAFRGDNCNNLTSVTIPASVISIGDHAFMNFNYNLTSVTFQGKNTIVNDGFFGNLRQKYLAGGPGTYIVTEKHSVSDVGDDVIGQPKVWTKK